MMKVGSGSAWACLFRAVLFLREPNPHQVRAAVLDLDDFGRRAREAHTVARFRQPAQLANEQTRERIDVRRVEVEAALAVHTLDQDLPLTR